MNEAPRKTTVTLEDLLRVKRAEQPPVEFWSRFEQGLRTKQLAAIVEPRPWWAPFIRMGARVSRFQLPVGATAVMALTLFMVSGYQPASQPVGFEPTAERVTLTPVVPVEIKAAAVDAVNVPVAASAATVAVNDPAPANVVAVSAVEQSAPAAATTVGSASHVAVFDSELTSARYMADNPAAAKASESNLDQMLGHAWRTTENTTARNEPLTQISVSGESPLYRWQGGTPQSASLNSSDSALKVNEQTARRLTERRLSEADVTSRLAVGVDRFIVKF